MEKRKYGRLTKAERVSIERGLDSRKSIRSIADTLGRAPSTVAAEVTRNRTVCCGEGKGERVREISGRACPSLERSPRVCNGCRHRHLHCGRGWKCEYSAPRAQALADSMLSVARCGVDRSEGEFEFAVGLIRSDMSRGLSPVQICTARAAQFKVDPSTVYRWIAAGYAGMSNMDLRRKVGYKPRRKKTPIRPTSHGPGRSHEAFLKLPEDRRASACEMDTVIGRARDAQCILTLYLRPCRFQVALLLPEKSSSAVTAALDSLELALGKEGFQKLFGLILTDNGTEFADSTAIERSAADRGRRCEVYYCDVRQSQQKAGCERNHVELRKVLPKGRGVVFDRLTPRDMAVLMSQMNSQPRPSLMGLSPAAALGALLGEAAEGLFDALGIEQIPYEDLDLTMRAIERERKERGLPGLAE